MTGGFLWVMVAWECSIEDTGSIKGGSETLWRFWQSVRGLQNLFLGESKVVDFLSLKVQCV